MAASQTPIRQLWRTLPFWESSVVTSFGRYLFAAAAMVGGTLFLQVLRGVVGGAVRPRRTDRDARAGRWQTAGMAPPKLILLLSEN